MPSDPAAIAAPRPLPADPLELAEAYACPAGRPWLRANMIASIDGAAWWNERTAALGNEADRRLFAVLRALADVVVVGAGTVRGEGYGPIQPGPGWSRLRAGRPAVPPLAVVSRALSLDLDKPIFTEARERTILLTTDTAPADLLAVARKRAEVIVCGADTVELRTATAELHARGYDRLLCEGGPRLLAQVAAEGLLDELCLTISPVVLAGAPSRILDGPSLAEAARMRLAGLMGGDDHLFLRYTRRNGEGPGRS